MVCIRNDSIVGNAGNGGSDGNAGTGGSAGNASRAGSSCNAGRAVGSAGNSIPANPATLLSLITHLNFP